jgi:hypothetical protein
MPVVKVSLTNEPAIEVLRERFGGYKSKPMGGIKQRFYWTWEVRNFNRVAELLSSILPWLRIKREHAKLVLELCAGPKNIWGQKAMPKEEVRRRASLYNRLRLLNVRWTPPAETKREDTPLG